MSRFATFVVSGVSALALAPVAGSLAPTQISPAAISPAVATPSTTVLTSFRTGNWCC